MSAVIYIPFPSPWHISRFIRRPPLLLPRTSHLKEASDALWKAGDKAVFWGESVLYLNYAWHVSTRVPVCVELQEPLGQPLALGTDEPRV